MECFDCGHEFEEGDPSWDDFACPKCKAVYSWEWESSADGETSGFCGFERSFTFVSGKCEPEFET